MRRLLTSYAPPKRYLPDPCAPCAPFAHPLRARYLLSVPDAGDLGGLHEMAQEMHETRKLENKKCKIFNAESRNHMPRVCQGKKDKNLYAKNKTYKKYKTYKKTSNRTNDMPRTRKQEMQENKKCCRLNAESRNHMPSICQGQDIHAIQEIQEIHINTY